MFMLDFDNIETHYWLKHPDHSDQKTFHVYLSRTRGAQSLCKGSPSIVDLNQMEIPGDHSPTCNQCSALLFGYDPLNPRKSS